MGILDSLIASFSGGDPNVIAGMTDQQRLPLMDNAIGGALEGFGANMGAMSHVMYGIQAQRANQFQATQLRQEANSVQGAAQRDAFNVQRQTDLVTSRALAVAAASGGGASDPTVVNIIARDAGQGAYEKAVALYGGADKARYLQEQASAKEFQGREELINSGEVALGQGASGVASILRSQARGSSLYSRFAGNGPPTMVSGTDPGW